MSQRRRLQSAWKTTSSSLIAHRSSLLFHSAYRTHHRSCDCHHHIPLHYLSRRRRSGQGNNPDGREHPEKSSFGFRCRIPLPDQPRRRRSFARRSGNWCMSRAETDQRWKLRTARRAETERCRRRKCRSRGDTTHCNRRRNADRRHRILRGTSELRLRKRTPPLQTVFWRKSLRPSWRIAMKHNSGTYDSDSRRGPVRPHKRSSGIRCED